MRTNGVPLVADQFLICYGRDFILSLSDDNQSEDIEAFNSTSRISGCIVLYCIIVLRPR